MATEIQNQTGFEKILIGSETNRFGLIAIALLIVGCLGGVAVGLGAINNIITLTLVVVPTMTTLSFLLAIAPMKWIYYAGISSIIIDCVLISYYLFQ